MSMLDDGAPRRPEDGSNPAHEPPFDAAITRRGALTGLAALAIAPAAGAEVPLSEPADRLIDVGGAELYVRDSGGSGPAVVLAHPASGSALVWQDMSARFAAMGFRVIAWSRRGHAMTRLHPGAPDAGATADLLRLIDALGIDRCHALGSAAGGGVMLDFAVAHPDRVRTLVVANNIGNFAEPTLRAAADRLRPAPFNALPTAFRELGPTYRAANPAGVARWEELERGSRTAPLGPPPSGTLHWTDLERLAPPALWITGGADFYAPPPLFAEHRRHSHGGEFASIESAGHSAYWEYPEVFARRVLAFWHRQR